jgi:hypothetical protein
MVALKRIPLEFVTAILFPYFAPVSSILGTGSKLGQRLPTLGGLKLAWDCEFLLVCRKIHHLQPGTDRRTW